MEIGEIVFSIGEWLWEAFGELQTTNALLLLLFIYANVD